MRIFVGISWGMPFNREVRQSKDGDISGFNHEKYGWLVRDHTNQYIGDYHNPFWGILINHMWTRGGWGFFHGRGNWWKPGRTVAERGEKLNADSDLTDLTLISILGVQFQMKIVSGCIYMYIYIYTIYIYIVYLYIYNGYIYIYIYTCVTILAPYLNLWGLKPHDYTH